MLLIASIPLHHLFQFQTANDEDRIDGGRPKRSKKNPVIAPLRDAINLRHHPKKVTLNCLGVDMEPKQQDPRQVILKDANVKAKDIVNKAAKGSVKNFPQRIICTLLMRTHTVAQEILKSARKDAEKEKKAVEVMTNQAMKKT